jgi:hypothetical protein
MSERVSGQGRPCWTCRYWIGRHRRDEDAIGTCRRYPPRAGKWGVDIPDRMRWPETNGQDWCGEHAPKAGQA